MQKFLIKTRATMEQTYSIEAENREAAEEIALSNTKEIIDQTQVDSGEVLEVNETE